MTKNDSSLPNNRFEGFFDIIHNQFSTIIKIGILTFLFFLPAIITLLLSNIKIYEINLSLKEELISSSDAIINSNGLINARNLLFIVFIPFAFTMLSGIYNIIRKLVYQEGILFWSDFKKGIKNNGLFFFVISLILCILYYLFSNTLRTYFTSQTIGCLIAICLSLISLIILFVFMPLLLHQTIIYNLKLIYRIKNAIIMTLRMFYIVIPLGIINLIPFMVLFVNNGVLLLILIILDFIILIPFLIVINTLVTDYIFDFFINYHHFKEIYRKGLRSYAENQN